VHGHAGAAVPDHAGFALIGDADRGDRVDADARLLENPVGDAQLRVPDDEGVVLGPAGRRIVLFELLLRDVLDRAFLREQDRAHAARSRVERHHVCLGHPRTDPTSSCVDRASCPDLEWPKIIPIASQYKK
jgi:hypothetical protein